MKLIRHILLSILSRCKLLKEVGFVLYTGDGREKEVDFMACGSCKNFLWVENLTIEMPKCCPFCEQRFTHVISVSSEEAKQIQLDP